MITIADCTSSLLFVLSDAVLVLVCANVSCYLCLVVHRMNWCWSCIQVYTGIYCCATHAAIWLVLPCMIDSGSKNLTGEASIILGSWFLSMYLLAQAVYTHGDGVLWFYTLPAYLQVIHTYHRHVGNWLEPSHVNMRKHWFHNHLSMNIIN